MRGGKFRPAAHYTLPGHARFARVSAITNGTRFVTPRHRLAQQVTADRITAHRGPLNLQRDATQPIGRIRKVVASVVAVGAVCHIRIGADP